MTTTVHRLVRDTAVKPMVFSHATAERPVTSPAVAGPDDGSFRDPFAARPTQPRP